MPRTRPATAVRPVVLNVHGMSCAACERRIEKQVLRLPGVAAVKASHRSGRLEVCPESGTKPGKLTNSITQAVEQAGYTIGQTRERLFTLDVAIWRDFAVAVVLVLALAFVYGEGGDLAGALSRAATGGSLGLVVLLGLAASVSTCMALVGGLVLGVTGRYTARHPEAGFARRMRPQLLFHLGRVLGFTGLGALLGAVGASLRPSARLVAILTVIVALVMIKLGVTMTGIAPGAMARLSLALPRRWTDRWDGLTDSSALVENALAAGLGVASFALPCAFTQTIQLYALSTGSPGRAAATLGLFALGTVPGLLAVAAAGSVGSNRHSVGPNQGLIGSGRGSPGPGQGSVGSGRGPVGSGRGSVGGSQGLTHANRGLSGRLSRTLGVVVIAFALVNLNGAVHVLAPSAPAQTDHAVSQRTTNVHDEDGVQIVETIQNDAGYNPNQTVIYVNQPVRWTITMEARGCASVMVLDSLGLGTVELNYPTTTLTFTPKATGVLPYSCLMGMFRGSFQVIDPPT